MWRNLIDSELNGANSFELDSQLKQMVFKLGRRETPGQSVLFYGEEGSDKEFASQFLAKVWLCMSPTESGACNLCDSCLSFDRRSHPDFLVIVPLPPSNIIRLNSILNTNSQDEIGQTPLQTFFMTSPIRGRHKVALIVDADRMNKDTANSLLKTLEEPPEHCRIILSTSKIGSLLPTIISRCLCIACPLPDESAFEEASNGLTEMEKVFSMGSPGRLERIRKHHEIYEELDLFIGQLSGLKKREVLSAVEQFKKIASQFELMLPGESTGRTREANATAVAELAIGCRYRFPEACPKIVESHRHILGNGSAGLIWDRLFSEIARN